MYSVFTGIDLDLASLPLGALRKAQRALARANALERSDQESSGEDDYDDEDSGPEQVLPQVDIKGKGKQKEVIKGEKAKIQTRTNKHAYVLSFGSGLDKLMLMFLGRPMEMSSKRPVPRKRLGADDKKTVCIMISHTYSFIRVG